MIVRNGLIICEDFLETENKNEYASNVINTSRSYMVLCAMCALYPFFMMGRNNARSSDRKWPCVTHRMVVLVMQCDCMCIYKYLIVESIYLQMVTILVPFLQDTHSK